MFLMKCYNFLALWALAQLGKAMGTHFFNTTLGTQLNSTLGTLGTLGTCDAGCTLDGGKEYSCRNRVTWVRKHDSLSLSAALARVNSECAEQCSCATADFDAAACSGTGCINVVTWNAGGNHHSTTGSCLHASDADLVLFQEVDDPSSKLHGLSGYQTAGGGGWSGMGFAWKESSFSHIDGPWKDYVGEDRDNCCCNVWKWNNGKCWTRYVVSIRLKHSSGQEVLVANHHGLLPINTGGKTGHATAAQNINNAVNRRMGSTELVIFAGDMNNVPGRSDMLNRLDNDYGYTHHYHGKTYGGVDAFYSKGFQMVGAGSNLGSCGSDHDLLKVSLQSDAMSESTTNSATSTSTLLSTVVTTSTTSAEPESTTSSATSTTPFLSTSIVTASTTSTEKPACVDKHQFCGFWKWAGFCDGYWRKSMEYWCMDSCEYCSMASVLASTEAMVEGPPVPPGSPPLSNSTTTTSPDYGSLLRGITSSSQTASVLTLPIACLLLSSFE